MLHGLTLGSGSLSQDGGEEMASELNKSGLGIIIVSVGIIRITTAFSCFSLFNIIAPQRLEGQIYNRT